MNLSILFVSWKNQISKHRDFSQTLQRKRDKWWITFILIKWRSLLGEKNWKYRNKSHILLLHVNKSWSVEMQGIQGLWKYLYIEIWCYGSYNFITRLSVACISQLVELVDFLWNIRPQSCHTTYYCCVPCSK